MCLFVRRIRCCSVAVTILLALALASTAANASPKPFSIDSEEAPRALVEFGRQSTLQILFATEKVKGIVTNAVHGNYEPIDALRLLLKGTPLVISEKADGVLVVQPQAKARNPANADPVSINNDGSSTQFTQPGSDLASNTGSPNRDSSSVSSGSDSSSLNEITVTAQKREERLQNVPISLAVLSSAQLESPTITSASDALSAVPGVAINQSYNGGGTVVGIRGVSNGQALFAGSSPVGYYIDSVPFGLVKSAIAPDEDVYDLQRVEVLRGPQGTLYGASALNGVVRVLTNDADLNSLEFKVRGSDSGTDGGGNNYRGDMAVNVPVIDGKLAVRAVLGYENDSGYIDTPIKNGVNDEELRNYRLKINAAPTDEVSLGLSYWGERDNYGAPNTGDDNYKNSSIHNQPIETGFDAYSFKVGYDASGYSLSSASSYLSYYDDADFDFSSLYNFPLVFFTGLKSDVLSQEFLLNSPSDGAWRWSIGGMFRRATESKFQYEPLSGGSLFTPITGFSVDQTDTSKSFAGYGEITRVFLDGLIEATVGARQFEDRVTQEGELAPTGPVIPAEGKFHATTPRVVLTWHVDGNHMVYTSYSQGFRSGFPQDVAVPAAIPAAQPDKLYNYEAGTKGNLWGGGANYDVAVYYMDWKHPQQLLNVPFGDIYTTAVVNGESASGEGIDIDLTSQPLFGGLTLGFNASWNNLEMDSNVYTNGVLLFHKGDRLSMSPETTGGASAVYAFALGTRGLTGKLAANVNYTSAQTYLANPGGSTVLTGAGDPIVVGRIAMSIQSNSHWNATLFVNNVNNDRGAIIRPYEDPDLTPRIRPMTAGVQFEYKSK